MRQTRILLPACLLIAASLLVACGSNPTPPPIAGPPPTATATSLPTRVPSSTPAPTPTALILPTSTPAPTLTPRPPTPTRSVVATPTPEASLTETAAPVAGPQMSQQISGPAVTVSSAGANVRSGPGTVYPVIGGASKGQQLAVTGRLQDGSWWQVSYLGKPAWIAASVVSASAETTKVAVVAQLPPTPAPSAGGATAGAQPSAGAAPAAGGARGSGHIAFARGNGSGSDLALLDVASGQVSILAGSGRQPDIYNDGWIVFKGAGNGRDNLWLVKMDGSGLKLVSEKAEDAYPSWAPDKHAIIFYGTRYDEERICEQRDLSGPQGNTALNIDRYMYDSPVPMFGRYPVFVENQRIAFTGCDGWANYTNCGIWVLFIEYPFGGGAFPYGLTSNPNDQPSDAAGDQLLYSSADSGNWEVYKIRWTPPARKVDPKGTPVNFSNDAGQDVGGTFSPDGGSVAWISNRGGTWGIWAAKADGSNKRLLAAVPEGFGPHWEQEKLAWGP